MLFRSLETIPLQVADGAVAAFGEALDALRVSLPVPAIYCCKHRSGTIPRCSGRIWSAGRSHSGSRGRTVPEVDAKDDDANEDVLFAGDPIVYHGGWGSQVCYHHPTSSKKTHSLYRQNPGESPSKHDSRAFITKPGITLLRLGFRGMMNIYSSERDVLRERHCIAKTGTPWPAVRLLVHQDHHLPVLKTHREK